MGFGDWSVNAPRGDMKMVYDAQKQRDFHGKPGYTVFQPLNVTVPSLQDQTDAYWSIYTDDGQGNGELVAYATDSRWAFEIANALDFQDAETKLWGLM